MRHKSISTVWLIPLVIFLVTQTACQRDSEKDKQLTSSQEDKQSAHVSVDDIESGIRSHIQAKTDSGGGYFNLSKDGEELQLKLVRVHTEYISKLGPNRHFACVDLAEMNGDVYDVDFFLEGQPGEMTVTQTTVHKLNGKPFYTWKQQEDKTWKQVPVEGASSDLMGVVEGEDEFEFRYKTKLPEIKGTAKLWISIAQSDTFQQVEILKLEVPAKHQMLKETEHGNTILYLEAGPEQSHQPINIIYNVKRREKVPYEEPVTNPENYLASTELIPVGGRFREIAQDAIAAKNADSDLTKARALYDYIIENIDYKKAGKYGTGDANYACDMRRGNCTEFHSFFISLARSAGIPARFAIGASIPSSRNEGGINGYHCWAEFYAEGKWWPLDISEGNKYTPLATYYFGHHPANRIELSKGRELKVEPGPQSGAISFIAYPLMEMDGQTTSLETKFSFSRPDG